MTQTNVLVLGIGNLLWADEGFGVRAISALNQHYLLPANVRLMDGGTQGLYLVPHVQQAEALIVFDAIDYGLPPGTLKIIRDADVPKFMGAKKMSLHQTGFQEVLALAELLGGCPQQLLLIGVQPVVLEDYGGSLSAEVKAQIAPAVAIAVDFVRNLGLQVTPRRHPLPDDSLLTSASLEIDAYEGQRPDQALACRYGDERVLRSPSMVYDPKPETVEAPAISVNLVQRGQG